MSVYLHWFSRVLAPRAGNVRLLACTTSSQAKEIDNDILEFAQGTTDLSNARTASYGRALVRFQNDDATNTIGLVFGTASPTANIAATSGNTITYMVYPRTFVDVECDPVVDKFFAAQSSGTATLRYYTRTVPMFAGIGSLNS